MEPAVTHQIALLREEIRQAGNDANGVPERTGRRLRYVPALGCALTPFAALIAVGTAIGFSGSDTIANATFCCVLALGLVGSLVAALVRANLSKGTGELARFLIRTSTLECQVKFRRLLASLSEEQQAAVLIPLRHHRTAGPVIAPLLREIDARAELTPAAAPEPSGDELSPS
jgi:hypothetical protein